MKKLFSIDAFRGTVLGLAGVAGGMGLTIIIRLTMGKTPWSPEPVYTTGILIGVITYIAAAGVFDHWARWAVGKESAPEPEQPNSWTRYLNVNTNHKIIGIQYLVTGLFFLPFAVALQVLGRFDLSKLVGSPLLNPSAYESVISNHGVVMLFIVVLPVFSGMMNYLVPLLIGARDMAFPRLNALSFWLVPAGGLLVALSFLGGGFDTGWTVYPPLSTSYEPVGMDMILLGVYFAGLSSILTGINVITTIVKCRAPGMIPFRMPVFVWSSFATTCLSLVFTQFIAMAFLMVLFERLLGMSFFRPEMGGKVLLYQHLFWFYSHPAVYIFILPGFGIISDLIPVFARKPLFGYQAVALSSPGIAAGGTLVYGHHMFASGYSDFLRVPFMITTLLVAVPTGVKVFAWVASMFLGKLRITTAFLFVLSSIIVFLIGGLTGVVIGIVPADLYLHDTYFIVGHFHATLFGGFLLPALAAIYFWFPKATGRMLSEKQGRVQWLLITLGTALILLPMLELGLEGMRRRVADYFVPGYQPWHFATFIGAILVFISLGIMAYNIVVSFKRGKIAGNNPWNARTLEWQISSPPPEENFAVIPEVLSRPHLYGVPGAPPHARMNDEEKAK